MNIKIDAKKYFIPCILFLASCFLLPLAFAEDSACLSCHEDVAKDWRESIHAENGISCHNCHGGNPKNIDNAMDPKEGFIGKPSEAEVPAFCGKCHVGVKENYTKSAHSINLTRGGPNCVTCHTSHKQKRANISLISKNLCAQCHSFERAEKIRNAMIMSETEITELEKRMEALRIQGHDVRPAKNALFATRNNFHRLTHVVNADLILKETTGINTEIKRLKAEIAANEATEVKRKIFGAIFIIFLLIGALIFWWYRNTILSE
ncbi:MAG: cytochrome C [Deltaproteobacteria bacterium CG11_big_fil_rev_8_21_14_0_20_49_13]|nr:MAG: cytochrome C [Deltaproteobacteria bacterium CG11_big_fil_rev_8_21_14_0_20_49_13]